MTKHKSVPAKLPLAPVEHQSEPDLGLERLVFFSDAVMAIAITLLALEIRLPVSADVLTSDALLQQLGLMWPQYFGYALSFFVIGVYWLGHNRQFRNLRQYDSLLVWLNLLFLALVAFLPFPTSIASEHSNSVATILYAGNIALIGLSMLLMWLYTHSRPQLWRQPVTAVHYRAGIYRQLVPIAVFLVSIPVALWSTAIARYLWAATAVLFLFRTHDTPSKD